MEDQNIKTIQIDGVDFEYNEEYDYERDGHVFCKKCNEQLDGKPVDLLNQRMIFRIACECNRKKKELQEQRERAIEVDRLKKSCFIERKQEQFTFEKADELTDKEIVRKAKRYVENFEKFREDNIGLIIYGGVGSGKTYLTCAIVNAIIEKYLYSCKVINFSQILNDLQMGGFNLDRNQYINNLTSKTLLVIDDFGIERDTEYALEQIYNVINARYQKDKPTIITTNIDYKELDRQQDNLTLERIYSRIREMGVPLKIDRNDRRRKRRDEKIDRAKIFMNGD